ncbi:MAG: hypothetical protein ABI543_04570 [Ignavibacteria bacterium]
MKTLILTIAITLSLVSGFSTVSAADLSSSSATSTTTNENRILIKVYEDGAIWVYVYEQDGTFVSKYVETLN